MDLVTKPFVCHTLCECFFRLVGFGGGETLFLLVVDFGSVLSRNSTEPSVLLSVRLGSPAGMPNSWRQVSARSDGDSEPDRSTSSGTDGSRLVVVLLELVVFAGAFFRPVSKIAIKFLVYLYYVPIPSHLFYASFVS